MKFKGSGTPFDLIDCCILLYRAGIIFKSRDVTLMIQPNPTLHYNRISDLQPLRLIRIYQSKVTFLVNKKIRLFPFQTLPFVTIR